MSEGRNRRVVMVLLACLLAAGTAAADVLIDCPDAGDNAGDSYWRGFYVPRYPGTTLDLVALRISPSVLGTYTIQLTARADTYDGTLLGQSEVTVPFTDGAPQEVVFTFPAVPVTQNGVVTFALERLAGDGAIYYDVIPQDPASCPVVQTQDTTPPLSSFRRDGIVVRIEGTSGVAAERRSWSMLRAAYR